MAIQLVLLPALMDDSIEAGALQLNTPANACIFWCISLLSKTGQRSTLHPTQQNRAFCLPSALAQIGKLSTGVLLAGFRKANRKRKGNVISHQINLALLHHLCKPENDVWFSANFGTVIHYGTNS